MRDFRFNVFAIAAIASLMEYTLPPGLGFLIFASTATIFFKLGYKAA